MNLDQQEVQNQQDACQPPPSLPASIETDQSHLVPFASEDTSHGESDTPKIPRGLADEPKAQPNTPESTEEEKDKEIQPQEPQVSLPKDHGADKSDKIEPNEASAHEQSHQKPDNLPDILRRDLKRIKSSVDDSFNRLGEKLNDLLNPDGKDENK